MRFHGFSRRRLVVLLLTMGMAVTAWSHDDDDDDGDELEFQLLGAGRYMLTGTDTVVDFTFFAEQDDDDAKGRFRQSLIFQDLPIEFHGKVTCLAVDADNGRVWVGGVVTRNLSVHPGFTTAIHAPGRDVWFRILDTGKKATEPDRSTFLGFEGAAGILTSEEYCEVKPWPDNNDRTHPVIKGKIRLKLDDD